MSNGQLYLISAPSGAGKTSMVSALLKQDSHIKLSVSHTTRAPREGEVDGQHYHFVRKDVFEALVVADNFLEHANVYDNAYGTSKAVVEEMLSQGDDVILEIDWQGARQVERIMPEAVSICIAPPSVQALRNRLEARGTDNKEVIDARMAQSAEELNHLSDAQYVIVNDNFSEAVSALQAIFTANRQQYTRQKESLVALGLVGGN